MSGEASVWNPRTLVEVSADTKRVEERFTATEGQVLFNITDFTFAPNTGSLAIFRKKVTDTSGGGAGLLKEGVDWAEGSIGNSFSLVVPSTAGDTLIAVGYVGVTANVDVRDTDIYVSNYQAVRDYAGAETVLVVKGKTVAGDIKERVIVKVTGAAPGTYVDDAYSVIVPSGGDGSAAWLTEAYMDADIKDYTVAEFLANTPPLKAGDVVTISDRAGATFDIATGVSGANTYNVIANTAATLKATLRNIDNVYVGEAFGIDAAASAATNTGAINAAFVLAEATGGTITLPAGDLAFTPLTFILAGIYHPVIIRGAGWNNTYMKMQGAGTWGNYAITIGDNAVSNSGQVTLDQLTVDGTNTTGEMSGVYITQNQRYQVKGDIKITTFKYGRGLYIEDCYLVNFGRFFFTYCFQAYDGDTVLSCTFDSFDVEVCGPVPSSAPAFWGDYAGGWLYAHSALADTLPTVVMENLGGEVGRMMIEASFSKTGLELTGPCVVRAYYSENDYPWATGNKFILHGDSPRILSGFVQHGLSVTSPNPRYVASMGTSKNAIVEGVVVLSNAGGVTNLPHMVDYASSVNAKVDMQFKGIDENLGQNAAKEQTMTAGTSKHYSLNGQTFDAGMETRNLSQLLLTNYRVFPANKEMNVSLMQIPNSSLIAKNLTLANVGADSIMKQFGGPFGAGRCQKVVATGSSTLAYAEDAAGTLNPAKKYYITTYMHKAAGTTAYAFVTNNATNYTLLHNGMTAAAGGLIASALNGWIRLSAVHTFAAATTHAIRYNLLYGPSAGTFYLKGLFVVDLSQFDTDYGTTLASKSILELDRMINPESLTSYMKEFTYNAAPVDGTYGLGDSVRRALVASGSPLEYACSVAGTPGTWVAGANAA